MDCKDFLDTAEFLLDDDDDIPEADSRSAISRAYYACFLTVVEIAYFKCSSESRRRMGFFIQTAFNIKL